MKKVLTIVSVLVMCTFFQIVLVAQTKQPIKFKGFLGTYHPFKGTAYGGNGWKEGELIQKAFAYGENAVISQAHYYGYKFAENIDNNCHKWDINKLYGVLRPPAEKGVVNQPKDTKILEPFRIEPGMIQGAKRFSELSKSCPQITGLIIDDFFYDYPKKITDEDFRDIKDALLGKDVDGNGNVNHSSKATTPRLKLYTVLYTHHLENLDRVKKETLALFDGFSYWMTRQNENYLQWDCILDSLRKKYPDKDIIAGVYLFKGRNRTFRPNTVHHVINRAIDLYTKGRVNGLLMFGAIWMSREKIDRKRWAELDLPRFLNRVYYRHLGVGAGRVIDKKTKQPIKNALVTVVRKIGNKRLAVSRKYTDGEGRYAFGGWAGGGNFPDTRFEITAKKNSFSKVLKTRLRARETVEFKDIDLRQ